MQDRVVRDLVTVAARAVLDTSLGEGVEPALAGLAQSYLDWVAYLVEVRGAEEALRSRQWSVAMSCLRLLSDLHAECEPYWGSYQNARLQEIIRLLQSVRDEIIVPPPAEEIGVWDDEYVELTEELDEELAAAEGAA